MRKVTEQTVHAFLDHKSKSVGNTTTDGATLFLHGNRIAWHGSHNGAEGVFVTLAGWGTPTTRERLQGVLSVMGHRSPRLDPARPCLNIYQEKHGQYIGAHSMDGTANAKREIGASELLFIVNPCTAKGLDAVTFAVTTS